MRSFKDPAALPSSTHGSQSCSSCHHSHPREGESMPYPAGHEVPEVSLDTHWCTFLRAPHFLLYLPPSPIPQASHTGSLSSQESPGGSPAMLGPSETAGGPQSYPCGPIFPSLQQRKTWFFLYTVLLPKHSYGAFLMNRILHFIT